MTRNMKDSGIEWCGMIPANWKVMPNKYVMYKKKELCSKYEGQNILSLTMDGVIVRDLDAGGKMPATFDGYQIVYPNNLLMCLFDYDVTPRCIGLIKDEGLTSPAYSQFVMKDNNKSGYYYYYYLMIDNTKELLHLAKNLRHSFTEEQLGSINAPVPPVEEQEKIVNFLNDKISEIDVFISKTKKSIEEYKKYKQAVIVEVITKGLDNTVPMKDSGINWIGQIPATWKMTKIKFLYEIVLGKMLCNEPKDETYTLENYFCSQNVKWKGVDTTTVKKMYFSQEEKETYLLKKGDLMITEGGSVGESCIYNGEASPCYIQNAIHKARGKNMNMNKYLFYWMQVLESVGYFSMICNRATIAHYTKEKVENTPIINMPVDVQYEVVEYLDAKCSEIDALIAKKETFVEEMETYKKSLIYEYVTGKKEVV